MQVLLIAAVLLGVANGAEYLACVPDAGGDLTGYLELSQDMTNEMCQDICKYMKFAFSGTGNGEDCRCGNKWGKNIGAHGPNCNTPCKGDNSQMCGGQWSLSVYKVQDLPALTAAKPYRLGCYSQSHPASMTKVYQYSEANTNENCRSFCKEKGYTYSGTTYAYWCSCDNEYERMTKLEDSTCDMPCLGDPSQMCGSDSAFSVYRTDDAPPYEGPNEPSEPLEGYGCWQDTGSSRDMQGFTESSEYMTNERCTHICGQRGFKYAGTQNWLCFCSDSYGRSGQAPDEDCTRVCSGDSSLICGGVWKNSVYKARKEPSVLARTTTTKKPTTEQKTTTPKVVDCQEKRALFATYNLPVEPQFTEKCRFAPKLCNDEKCFCVKPRTGAPNYRKAEVPLDNPFACTKKPKFCQRKLFKTLLKGGTPAYIPQCTKSGKFQAEQCKEDKSECWCAKPRRGKEIKNTRTNGRATC